MSGQQVPFLSEGANITAPFDSTTCADTASSSLLSFMMPVSALVAFISKFFFGITWTIFGPPKTDSIRLPSYALAVKHPYLSTWVPGDQLDDIAKARPEFWSGQKLSWPVVARVDNCTYALFGMPDSPTNGIVSARTKSVSYTSTHTIFHLSAGDASVILDFFSPVSPAPEDYARQSLPYSYLTVSVSNPTESAYSVQVGAGIDQTWTNQGGAAHPNFSTSDGAQIFQYHNPNEILFTETNEAMATYGTVVWATANDNTTSHATGSVGDIFDGFVDTGSVTTREGSGSHHDMAALSKDLGGVSAKQTKNATFVVGFDRSDAINYLGNIQTGYYRTRWPSISEALDFVLQDYDAANLASQDFDKEVRARSESVSDVFGDKYADIIEASVRQTFGALELTVSIWPVLECRPP